MSARILLLGAAACALAAPVMAQPVPETDVIVVRSTPVLAEADSLVGSVDVFGEDEIIRRLNGNLGDTLASLPGVESTFFGPASGRPVIRGLGAERVQVLVNGLGLIDASSSSPDHALSTDPLGVESIEILRGPAAIAFGGGAVGGVVNVFDGRIAETAPEKPLEGDVYAGYTSVNEGSQFAGRVRAAAGPLVFQLQGDRQDADEFEVPGFVESARLRALEAEEAGAEDEGEEEAFGVVGNSDFTFESYGGGVSWVGEAGFIGFAVKQLDANYGLPGEGEEEGEEEEDAASPAGAVLRPQGAGDGEIVRLDLEQTRYDLRGEWRRDGFFNQLRGALAYADYAHVELEGDEIGTRFTNEGIEGRIELRHEHDGPRQGAAGLQFADRDFAALGEEAFVEPATTTEIGVFAVERWDFGGWGVEGGARYERRDVEGSVLGTPFERDFDAFSFSGSAFMRPQEEVFLGLTLSRTERAPTDLELFSNGPHLATQAFEIGDPDLGKETAWTIEGAARWTGERVRAEAVAFGNIYSDFIGLFPTGLIDADEDLPVLRYLQTDATFVGFELSGEADLFEIRGLAVSGDAAIGFVEADSDLGELPRIPPLEMTAGLNATHGALSGRAELEYHADQSDTAEFELPTDSFTFVNLSAEWRPRAEPDVAIILGVRNVFDEEGRTHTSFLKDLVPLPGRNVRVAVRAAF